MDTSTVRLRAEAGGLLEFLTQSSSLCGFSQGKVTPEGSENGMTILLV